VPTRQREWQKKMAQKGRCPRCGKRRRNSYLCKTCNQRHREKMRKKYRDRRIAQGLTVKVRVNDEAAKMAKKDGIPGQVSQVRQA
jgi:hypothetical protein